MKTSNAIEFSMQAAGSLAFRLLSAVELEGLLEPLYLSLPFDERRARFGAALSDDSIARYCRELHLSGAIVIGCVAPDGLAAVVELHPYGECVELALAGREAGDRIRIYGHLLQLAAFEAGRRGCRWFAMDTEPSAPETLELLRGMGPVCIQNGTATVELGDYARLHALSLARG